MKKLRKETDLKEKVSKVIGGKVLRLSSDVSREEKGVMSGRIEDKAKATMDIVHNGMSVEDICALAECDIEFVEKVGAKL